MPLTENLPCASSTSEVHRRAAASFNHTLHANRRQHMRIEELHFSVTGFAAGVDTWRRSVIFGR